MLDPCFVFRSSVAIGVLFCFGELAEPVVFYGFGFGCYKAMPCQRLVGYLQCRQCEEVLLRNC